MASLLVVLGIGMAVLLAGLCLVQNECELITLTPAFSSGSVANNGTSQLKIEIEPKQDINLPITLYIQPQDPSVFTISRSGMAGSSGSYTYVIPQQDRKKGDSFTTTFNVAINCNCKSGKWDVTVIAVVGNNCQISRTTTIRAGGYCVGTNMLVFFVAAGILVNMKLGKR